MEQKVARAGRRFSRDSKQQARNIDLEMVVRRADSRCGRAKGRCEKPAPDRQYEQADLVALIRDRRKTVAGSQQESVPDTCLRCSVPSMPAGGEAVNRIT